MLILQNEKLKVSILHPVLDQQRLGSRYCTGGYIWQISDLVSGDLLSGPQFPAPSPTKFDGQGIPEVFETALGQDTADVNEEVLVIGVGRVIRKSSVQPFHVRDNPDVSKFCNWEIKHDELSCIMKTTQSYRNSSFDLVREVYLQNRTVISRSILTNIGKDPIPLRWFAHPFFPHTDNLVCCKFSKILQVPENPGFILNENGYLAMRNDYPWAKGLFLPLEMEWGEPVFVKQCHPLLTNIEIQLSFPVSRMPVWANAFTFSFEPYLQNIVFSGNSQEWFIEYRF